MFVNFKNSNQRNSTLECLPFNGHEGDEKM